MFTSLFLFVRSAAVVIALAVVGVRTSHTTEPVGSFRLATVNGSRVPMVWHRVELPAGGVLQLAWLDGSAVVASDGTILMVISSAVTGPGAPGTPTPDSVRGSWHRDRLGRVQIRFADGRRTTWPATDGFRSLTLRAGHTDLDGERREITLVLVREQTLSQAPLPGGVPGEHTRPRRDPTDDTPRFRHDNQPH